MNINRIDSLVSTLSAASNQETLGLDSVDFGRFAAEESDRPAHAVFAPMHYERKYAYPLIVWLHGPQDTEHQLKRVMPLVSMRNYVAVAPRGTTTMETQSGDAAYGWGDSPEQIREAEERVFDCIEAVRERFHIAPRRVFLAGLFEAGTMAYRVALSQPQAFAGVISLGGRFPKGDRPLRRLDEIRSLPFLLSAGSGGHRYSERAACEDLRLMHTAGMSVTLRLYPCGDELTTQMLADMDHWTMDLVCQHSSPTAVNVH